jgi:hypothetical protein
MTKQPEALRLADALDAEFAQGRISNHTGRKAAAELRRLHEVNQELLKALKGALFRLEQYDYQAMERAITTSRAAIAKATGEQE